MLLIWLAFLRIYAANLKSWINYWRMLFFLLVSFGSLQTTNALQVLDRIGLDCSDIETLCIKDQALAIESLYCQYQSFTAAFYGGVVDFTFSVMLFNFLRLFF